jgi:hypothetical protein
MTMETSKPNPIVRVLPSLTDLAFALPFLLLFVRGEGFKNMLGDGDTGWHIRTGQWIMAHHQVPHTDMFSFTRPGAPWFAWEWLWDVIFGWLHLHWGMAAVTLGSLLVLAFTSALVFRLVHRKCTNVLIAAGVSILAVAGSSMHWLARPHLFTLLFVVIFYSILERVSGEEDGPIYNRPQVGNLPHTGLGNAKLLWLLPVLTILWTNLHAGFLAGIILIGCYAAGELTAWVLSAEPERRKAALGNARLYLLSAAGCFLASFLNPYFYHLHQHIYAYLTDAYQFKYISEFQTISFHEISAKVYLEPMIVLAAITAAWSLYRRRFVYVFLLLGWLHLALMAGRNIPIFMFVAAPPVALTLNEMLGLLSAANVAGWVKRAIQSLENLAGEIDETDRIGRAHLVSAGLVLLIVAISYAPGRPPKFQAEYDPKHYPAKAADALAAADPSWRIFTEDVWGGYMIYRYPERKVFIDGRSDFYGDKFGQKYLDTMNGTYDWEENLRRYHVDTILLPTDAALVSTLKESKDWRTIYDDGTAIAFRLAGTDGSVSSASGAPGSEKGFPVLDSSGKGRDRRIAESESQSQHPRRRAI